MKSDVIKKQYEQNVMHTYGRFDVCLNDGSGAICHDVNGKEYIDFGSGIGVNSLGFCDDDWAEAVSKQAHTLNHASNLYYNTPAGELAEILCKATSMDKVFFANSGAEANEGAIKIARKRSSDKYGENRYEIITLVNSFHGRTMATLTATGQDVFHKHFNPFLEGFVYCEANNVDMLESLVSDKTCGVMLEIVQGEGGVMPLSNEFLSTVQKICDDKDIALIVDEVQTGIGRTGTLLAFEQFNLHPNIITLAKGLGGGLPIGAVMADSEYGAVLQKSDHGTTFGGNPIACAGAVCVMKKVLADGFLADVKRKGEIIRKELADCPNIEGISGLGMMIGITLKEPLTALDVVNKCIENGVIPLTAKNKVRLLPPLNISETDLVKGLNILKKVISE